MKHSLKKQQKNAQITQNRQKKKTKLFYSLVKQIFDILFSLLSLIILSPVFLIIAIVIKLHDGGKVIYVCQRVGKGGKLFNFYKFRSMQPDADEVYPELVGQNETSGATFKMENDPRITKIGRFLRRTSLDELPQLVNILRGDMSFVGPRPPLLREYEKFNDFQKQKLDVIGGLTCYWQIMGRSTVDFDGMIELDLKYIKERGFLTDLKILLLTFPAVIKGKGAY